MDDLRAELAKSNNIVDQIRTLAEFYENDETEGWYRLAARDIRAILGESPDPDCCHYCYNQNPRDWPRMIVCNDCGNKRCPKATNHKFDCTGSNAPGQPGSVY